MKWIRTLILILGFTAGTNLAAKPEGWFWEEHYPYIYHWDTQTWYYLQVEEEILWAYNFSIQYWEPWDRFVAPFVPAIDALPPTGRAMHLWTVGENGERGRAWALQLDPEGTRFTVTNGEGILRTGVFRRDTVNYRRRTFTLIFDNAETEVAHHWAHYQFHLVFETAFQGSFTGVVDHRSTGVSGESGTETVSGRFSLLGAE